MSAASTTEWRTEPFRSGTPEQFARLRALLRRCEYQEPALCARVGISAMQDYWHARDQRDTLSGPNDAQALLMRLFLDAEDVALPEVHALLGNDLATITALGLLEAGVAADTVTGTVLLYPTEHLWIVSDRNIGPSETSMHPPADVVYPAIAHNTQGFVGLMPRTPVERCLELCAGTGIAALLAATTFAERAWAVDITGRATRFARFNALLNDVQNCVALEGDLYAPLANEMFDRIVAHPPYMPSLENEYIFRDGGEDGERVTWRILRGLAEHLRPGGDFFCECLLSDRRGAPIEARIREALGSASAEFDILVGEMQQRDPVAHLAELEANGQITAEMRERLLEVFRRLEIESLVFGVVLARRGLSGHAGTTVRGALEPWMRTRDLFEALDRGALGR